MDAFAMLPVLASLPTIFHTARNASKTKRAELAAVLVYRAGAECPT